MRIGQFLRLEIVSGGVGMRYKDEGDETDLVLSLLALEPDLSETINDVVGAFEEVLPDEGPKGFELWCSVAVLVDDLHLLHDCRLSRLTGAWRVRYTSDRKN